jgi:hypothetical protein
MRLGGPPEPVWTRSENVYPYRDSNSDPSVVQHVASRYTDCAILNDLNPPDEMSGSKYTVVHFKHNKVILTFSLLFNCNVIVV